MEVGFAFAFFVSLSTFPQRLPFLNLFFLSGVLLSNKGPKDTKNKSKRLQGPEDHRTKATQDQRTTWDSTGIPFLFIPQIRLCKTKVRVLVRSVYRIVDSPNNNTNLAHSTTSRSLFKTDGWVMNHCVWIIILKSPSKVVVFDPPNMSKISRPTLNVPTSLKTQEFFFFWGGELGGSHPSKPSNLEKENHITPESACQMLKGVSLAPRLCFLLLFYLETTIFFLEHLQTGQKNIHRISYRL